MKGKEGRRGGGEDMSGVSDVYKKRTPHGSLVMSDIHGWKERPKKRRINSTKVQEMDA